MKICFRCKHYRYDCNEDNALLKNVCCIKETDPTLCYLKNSDCNCPDYEPKEDVTKEEE